MPYGFDDAAWDAAKAEAKEILAERARVRGMMPYSELADRITALSFDYSDARFNRWFLREVSVEEHAAGRGDDTRDASRGSRVGRAADGAGRHAGARRADVAAREPRPRALFAATGSAGALRLRVAVRRRRARRARVSCRRLVRRARFET